MFQKSKSKQYQFQFLSLNQMLFFYSKTHQEKNT